MSEIIVQVDSREKENSEILDYFNFIGQKWFCSKVPSGDYVNFKNPKIVIDAKKNLLELANNLTKDHSRFLREIMTAKNDLKCEFVVLIREPLNCLEEVKDWSSKHSKVKGETLYKTMNTMATRYGIHWRFCRREESGAKILSILKWFDENR